MTRSTVSAGPFTDDPRARLGSLGEVELLHRLRGWLGSSAPPAPHGMGDDCAVLPPGPADNLLTVDSVALGRHFTEQTPAPAVGAKLLKRNLSDIAAMGGRPGSAVCALFLPGHTSLAWLEGFARGLADCARHYRVPLVGGDLCQTDGFLGGSLTLTGRAERPLLRTGGRPGDWLAVTGALGGSLLGGHLAFTPRLAEGAWLAAQPEVRAALDLSDGLAKDLPALLAPGVGAVLDWEALPIGAAARRRAAQTGRTARDHAWDDGEDYELLLAIDSGITPAALQERWSAPDRPPLTWIGRLEARPSGAPAVRRMDGQPLPLARGYEHFR